MKDIDFENRAKQILHLVESHYAPLLPYSTIADNKALVTLIATELRNVYQAGCSQDVV